MKSLKEQAKFDQVVEELEDIQGELPDLHSKNIGIRSTQVGALILYLIRKGIIK